MLPAANHISTNPADHPIPIVSINEKRLLMMNNISEIQRAQIPTLIH